MKTRILLSILLVASTMVSAQKDWANFRRYENANKTALKDADAVFMGNSITDNWYHSDSAFFKSNNLIGRGIGGQTTSEMLVRFRADVINLKPKAVVILAGTNDIAENNGYISLENIMGNLKSMADLAKAHKIKVLMCTVMPVYKYPWRPEISEPSIKIQKLNAMIKAYCQKHKFTFVDFYAPFVDERGGMPVKYAADGVHPNLDCYKIMEQIVLKDLKKALKKN
jgi:lysophospholipase L1-like esterase